MKVDYKEGTISFDLHDMLSCVCHEKRLEMIESLACDDAIIKHVTDQIIHRWTENSFSGSSVCTIPSDSSRGCPLDDAWRRVAKMSGDVAKAEIERLERGLERRDKQIADLHDEIRKMTTRNHER
jgi:hypothetical protein